MERIGFLWNVERNGNGTSSSSNFGGTERNEFQNFENGTERNEFRKNRNGVHDWVIVFSRYFLCGILFYMYVFYVQGGS